MSTSDKRGTCLFCHQPERMVMPPTVRHQPHLRETVVDLPEIYFCNVLSFLEQPPPPPIARHMGCFEIEPGDCETCVHYEPADGGQLNRLWISRGKPRRRKKSTSRKKVPASG